MVHFPFPSPHIKKLKIQLLSPKSYDCIWRKQQSTPCNPYFPFLCLFCRHVVQISLTSQGSYRSGPAAAQQVWKWRMWKSKSSVVWFFSYLRWASSCDILDLSSCVGIHLGQSVTVFLNAFTFWVQPKSLQSKVTVNIAWKWGSEVSLGSLPASCCGGQSLSDYFTSLLLYC